MKYPGYTIVLMSLALGASLFTMTTTQVTLKSTLQKVIHENGYGLLQALFNTTKYPCDIYFVQDRPEDFLPEQTIIRIKSLADEKYFSYRQQEDKTFTCKPDTTDPKDPTTLFTIRKGIAPDLTPRISLSPESDPKVFLTYDPESMLLKFLPIDFALENNKQCHWFLESPYIDAPSKLDKIYMINRLSGGCLTIYRGKETVKLEPDIVKEERLNTVFGLTFKSPQSILSKCTYNDDKNSDNWPTALQSNQNFVQLSAKDNSDAWAITKEGTLFHWDGIIWTEEKLGAAQQYVSIADDGTVYCIGSDKILRTKTPNGWRTIDYTKKWSKISVRNKDEVWGIDAQDNQIYKLNAQKISTSQPLTGGALDISVAASGAVWAVNTAKQVSRFDGTTWLLIPSLKFIQVSALSNDEVWGIGADDKLPYLWNGTTLKKMSNTSFDYIFAPSGTKKIIIPGRTEERMAEGASVVGSDTKLQTKTETALVGIEIEKLGMGGAIKPLTLSEYVAIPMKKKPRVAGFAETQFEDFKEGATLSLMPLLSKGIAWLEKPLATPGRTTITFTAVAGDAGGVEVIFGQEISTNFVWKVIIGGWNNAKSGIINRTLENSLPKETLVAHVLPQEDSTNTEIPAHPLACVPPGQLVPYWVTIDNGLILVGMGSPGENIFMSWRDPNPPQSISYIGLASDTDSVEYSNILLGSPTVIEKAGRVYKTVTKDLSPKKQIIWTDTPFRVNNRGAVAMTIQGQEQVAIVLGNDTNPSTEDFYQIVFGYKKNEGIAVQKWIESEKRLKTISSITAASYKNLILDPQKKIPFWISYNYGQIMVGQGAIGKNLLLCIKDIAPLEAIRSIGYAALSGASAAISAMAIYPPLSFTLESSVAALDFSGKLTVIFPFEYQFSQLEQSIKMEDLVNHQSFYVAATPQQGSLYPFILSLDKMGTPKLDPYGRVIDDRFKDIQELMTKAQAEIKKQRDAIAQLSKIGVQEKESFDKQAKGKNAEAAQETSIATAARQVGLMMANKGSLTGNPFAAIAGMTMIMGALGTATAAEKALTCAGDLELQGKEAQIAIDRRAIVETEKAEQMDAMQALLSGQAKFSFRASDSYVYIDKADRGSLGSAVISPESAEKISYVQSTLSTLATPTIKTFATYISTVEKVILSITDLAVVGDANVRKQIYTTLQVMFEAYSSFFPNPDARPAAIHSQIMNILLSAYNNTFLNNELDTEEATVKKAWITWINSLVEPYLGLSNTEIIFEPMFGEYIWFPQPIVDGKVMFTFQAKAANDIFIAFSPIKQAVRNTSTDLYEVVLGGWDDTKSVIRVKSLDYSAAEVMTEDLLNTLDYQTYWIAFDNGLIKVGTGQDPTNANSMFFEWQDPYPNHDSPIKYIGFSCWNSPMTLKNITFMNGQDE